jgi:hypothetical protein
LEETFRGNGERMSEEMQFDMSKMVEGIRESTEEQLKWLMQHRGEPDDEINQSFVHTVMQTYLLTEILEKLESMDERLNNIYWDAREYHEQ